MNEQKAQQEPDGNPVSRALHCYSWQKCACTVASLDKRPRLKVILSEVMHLRLFHINETVATAKRLHRKGNGRKELKSTLIQNTR
jgi:hypothetical protein